MIRSLVLPTVITVLAATTILRAEENVLTPAEQKAGWKLLFDGKSTAGWRNFKKPGVSDGWVVQDGALVREKAAGDIITAEQYDNFELSLEYNIAPKGNSGVMFHVTEEEDTPWKTGPEVQVQDNIDGHDPQKSGWLYQLYEPAPAAFTGAKVDATRPPGQWNHLRLQISAERCEIDLNGIRYAQFKKGSPDWDARVAKSKFANFPNFGKPTKGHLCLQDHGDLVKYRNLKVRVLNAEGSAPDPVDSTLALKVEPAFPKVQWEGYTPEGENGLAASFRPIVVTHAGDGSNRIFVAEQTGVIYVLPNDQNVEHATKFFDFRNKVTYKDSENEEGLLGLAFHPKYKENGQFFVFYTPNRLEPHTHVVSRFRVSADPQKADPVFEEEVLRLPSKKFWIHNGGTIAFGPDGMLYIGVGDGGPSNDALGNGQNLRVPFGKILRIDVDHKTAPQAYAVPADNPFVGKAGALPEIWAYGFRNIWRFSFDRKTGRLWEADVGQDLWEEINLVTRGGNYGWSLREGDHPFGNTPSTAPTSDFVAPIWEYDHIAGKSITGGGVYRGTRLGTLVGKYLYADFVTGKIWALAFDEATAKVTANHAIPSDKMPIITFGEDETGEVYFTMVTRTGKGLFRFAAAP